MIFNSLNDANLAIFFEIENIISAYTKEYFERNPQDKPQHSEWSARSARRATPTEPPKPTSFIAADTVAQTLHGYDRNNLFLFLKSNFGPYDAGQMMREYCVRTSKHWPGSCVFWQTDINGCVRTGKVMLYDAESGKRVKEPFNHVSWANSLMKLPHHNLRQCFFGEHLLPMNRGKPVALVESEKTALIASWYLPEYVWLATGGKNGCLNADALRVLSGRQVILYPDLGATEQWRQKLPLNISDATWERLERYARILGDRGANVGSYAERIICEHLDLFGDDLEAWRKL